MEAFREFGFLLLTQHGDAIYSLNVRLKVRARGQYIDWQNVGAHKRPSLKGGGFYHLQKGLSVQ
jgi:hypothetical protein